MTIYTERVYELSSPLKKPHFLVDRIWPRGIKKEDLDLTAWSQEVAPSNELRKWFNHEPEKWDTFQRRYFAELDDNPESWEPILKAADRGAIVLLYGAKDKEHNQAVALKAYLEARGKRKKNKEGEA